MGSITPNVRIPRVTTLTVHQFKVSESVPWPARTVVAVVQNKLGIAKQAATTLIHGGSVRIDKRVCVTTHQRLEVGQSVVVDYDPPAPRLPQIRQRRSQNAFEILHDDDELMIVLKPAGLLTVPTPHREKHTLIGLINRYQDKRSQEPVYCCHRLDRGVSGVLCFAKSLAMAEEIRNQFAARKPDRTYIALVSGVVDAAEGTIRSKLATDENLNRYSTDGEGQLAITHWKKLYSYRDATALSIRLETGRRNQIRVHMAESGHPILGDPRYRRQEAQHRLWPHRRLALHAESLGLRHPKTGQSIAIKSEWPVEIKDFHRRQRRNSS